MILKVKDKEITIFISTRKLVIVQDKTRTENFEELYFDAMSKLNIKTLAEILLVFAEDKEGNEAFNNIAEVYDFIDEYKKENNKSYSDIFKELAEVINNEGFFNKKMTKKDMEQKILDPLSTMKLNDMIQPSIEKAITEIARNEIAENKLKMKD